MSFLNRRNTAQPAAVPRGAALLKKRTLTNLYNEHPAWLDNAHRGLGAATAGFANIANEDARSRRLALR